MSLLGLKQMPLSRALIPAAKTALTIGPATSALGLAITELRVNGTNRFESIAQQPGIDASDMDFRLYPTSLEGGDKRAFRAVIQDMNALVDAGTPTCVTWQTVDRPQRDGLRLDEFVFALKNGLEAIAVGVPAMDVVLQKTK